MKPFAILLPLLSTLTLTLAGPASGQILHVEEGRLGLPSAVGQVQTGAGVSISGQRVAVGIPGYSKVGRCATFTRSAGLWQLDATVDTLDGVVADLFGSAVALQGDTLVVGAPNSTIMPASPGSAYVFARTGSTWTQVQKFVPAVPKNQGLFGAAVALDGDTLVIGAPQIDPGSQGEVLVYVRVAGVWSFQQKLVPAGLIGAARAGTSVAIEGNRIVIGAPTDSPGNVFGAGRVFVFQRTGSTWTQSAVLDTPAPINGGHFGRSVALDGSRIAVGAEGEPQTAGLWGRAHTFTLSGATWTHEQTLAGSGTDTQNVRFGDSLALEGNRLVVGAPGNYNAASGFSGAVKYFERVGSTWTEQFDLFSYYKTFSGQLGHSVALEGDWVVGGAPGASSPFLSGEAIVWKLAPPTPSTYCTAKLSSAGCTAAIAWSGVPSASSGLPFLITASQVQGLKPGLLIYSTIYGNTPFMGGTLCIGGTVKRTAGQFSGGNSGVDCSGSFGFDFNAYLAGGLDPSIGAGSWIWSQYWYRDPAAPAPSGLSNALRFHIAN